jgi:hypothetical protein
MPDHEKLMDALLSATLTHHYSYFERRLDAAVPPQDDKVCRVIAGAAIDLMVQTCDPELVAAIERRRAALVEAMIAERRAIDRMVFELTPRLDRPRFIGPVNTIFNALRRINLIIAGCARSAAGQYAQLAKVQFFAEAQFNDSTALGWPDLAGRNAIVYGTPSAPLIGELLAEAGWQVTAEYIALGGRRFDGEQLALIACRARPADATLGDVIYTCADETALVGINQLHHGPSDYVIGRRTRADRYHIVARGNFARGPEGELLTTLPA